MSDWGVVKRSVATTIALARECTVCGRDPSCDVVVPFPAVSRQHFQIHCRLGGCYLEDLYSRGGTHLRQLCSDPTCSTTSGFSQITGLMPLREGDVFGHPADLLTLERIAPVTPGEWANGLNSQVLLTALRGTQAENPEGLLHFIATCDEMLEKVQGHKAPELHSYPDRWCAAAERARSVVALATADLLLKVRSNQSLRQKSDAVLWLACEAAERKLCTTVRKLFNSPFVYS